MGKECAVLFCGAGLATLGLAQAGLRPILAVDCDGWAATSHNLNFPSGPPVVEANLLLRPVSEVLAAAGPGPSWGGVAWLSPPCESFSVAGRKDPAEDVRSGLLLVSAEVADALPGAWVITENVHGLMVGKSRPFLERLLGCLMASGRRVETWTLACEHWVPSQRPRIFVIAAPVGYSGKFPEEPNPQVLGLPRRPMIEALGEGFEDVDPEFIRLKPLEYLLYSEIPGGGNWESTKEGSLARRYAELMGIGAGQRGNFLRRPGWNEPAPAIVATHNGMPGRMSAVHPDELRGFTVGEARALMGVPPEFVIGGGVERRLRQVGSGVPPPVARSIAEAILAAGRG